ncbi:hypothetical protein CYMTET_31288 [Cymbomonas tetramitiformis]|uniref:Uncharacterized protein n=1 Tax=Cymbomonas tetramitiformis TaxID=36881 RepID=A0AAE0KT43_9CHLO|nr:hypothetical protein CYMTET_31288 [Cymbomonas tetramitiformis]
MPPKKAAAGKAKRAASPTKKPAGKGKGVASGKDKKPAQAAVPQFITDAAIKIQARIRGYLARKHVKKMREDKIAMEKEMEELRANAYRAEVEYERKQQAKQRKKDQEERARIAAEKKLRKELLEACFDDEEDDVIKLLAQPGADVEMADTHNNTCLSEAAAGGAAGIVRLLLSKGADPNSQGEFKRTPLWRACFLGHDQVISMLLDAGADPRIGNDTGEIPKYVANKPEIREMLEAFDLSKTDKLVAQFNARKAEKEASIKAQSMAKINEKASEVTSAKEAYERDQKNLKKAHQELEKRIHEYDTVVGEAKPEELCNITLQTVKDAEKTLEEMKVLADESADNFRSVKLALRNLKDAEGAEDEDEVGIRIELKELDEVLMRDVGNKIRDSGKWPLVIDVSKQVSVFLRYTDTNYVNACSSTNMEPNKLRRSLLGGIRYGKPMVLDLMDVDLMDEIERAFDVIEFGLFDEIMSKGLLQNEAYMKLIRKDDGEEYHPNKFQDSRAQKFKLIIITSNRDPKESLVESTYVMRVKVKK